MVETEGQLSCLSFIQTPGSLSLTYHAGWTWIVEDMWRYTMEKTIRQTYHLLIGHWTLAVHPSLIKSLHPCCWSQWSKRSYWEEMARTLYAQPSYLLSSIAPCWYSFRMVLHPGWKTKAPSLCSSDQFFPTLDSQSDQCLQKSVDSDLTMLKWASIFLD